MSNTRARRQFVSGSRPAPDPSDKYLDFEGFYRKHTARDASSLFRVISEQMFDTQEYYEQIRKDCINFMIKNRKKYEDKTPINFDEYMFKMSKPKTSGTLLELRAMGYMYKRNILLYKPYDLGMWLIKEKHFDDQCFRVFYTPNKHFDSVFTKSFIVKAAFCQAICYEILYKNVFKLPDIEYSVEMMLHNNNENDGNNAYTIYKNGGDKYASHIVLQDGRKFQLNVPDETLCILDDHHLCHYHNHDFEAMMHQYSFNNTDMEDIVRFRRLLSASLPDKHMSCVRQLLTEGITPFPYKVAKALDPDIYRNIEFDSWSEYRKELRAKCWYSNGWNFQVGVKCLVKLDEKQSKLFKCHIQEISPNKGPCVVFVEDLAEKHTVPYSNLQPLDDAKQWMLPHRYNRSRISFNTFTHNGLRHEKKQLFNIKNPKYNETESELIEYTKKIDSNYQSADKIYDLDQYTNLSNFQPYSLDIVAMPLTVARSDRNTPNSGNNKSNNRSNSQFNTNNDLKHQQQNNTIPPHLTKTDAENNSNLNNLVDQQQQQPQQQTYPPLMQDQQIDTSQTVPYIPSNNSGFYYFPITEYSDQGYYNIPPEIMSSSNFYPVPPSVYTNPNASISTSGYCTNPAMPGNAVYSPMPAGSWSNYNPPINAGGFYMPTLPNQPLPNASPVVPLHLVIRRKDLLFSNGRANYNVPPSYAPLGNDLPFNDKITLRFFYNMGHEYLKYIQNTYGMSQFLALVDSENSYPTSDMADAERAETGHNQLATDFQQLSFESNDPESGTPNKQKIHTNYHPGNAHNRRYVSSKFKKDKPNFNQHRQPHQMYHPHHTTAPNGASTKKVIRHQGQNGSKLPYNYSNAICDVDDKNDSNTNDCNDANNNTNNNVDSNKNIQSTPSKNPNAKYQHSDSQYQHGASASINRENVYNPPDVSNYGSSLYPPYQPQFMPYYPADGNEQQPMYMPLNIYTQPGFPRSHLPPMTSPCEVTSESAEPFIGNYYNQPPFLYPPPIVPPPLAAQNFYYPSPAVVSQPPPRSLNSSNISSASSNITGANTSTQSQ